jgi:hypothetical protein
MAHNTYTHLVREIKDTDTISGISISNPEHQSTVEAILRGRLKRSEDALVQQNAKIAAAQQRIEVSY